MLYNVYVYILPDIPEEKVCELCDTITHCHSIISQINKRRYDFCDSCLNDFNLEEQRILDEIEDLKRGAGRKLGIWFARTKAVNRINSRQVKLFSKEEGEGESSSSDPSPGDMGLFARNPRRSKAM